MTSNAYQFYPFPIIKGATPHISVRHFGDDLKTCAYHKRVHRHRFFEVAWLSRGELSFFIDFATYRLQAGSLVFISPGQVHALDGDKAEVELTIVSFSPELFLAQGDGLNTLVNLPFYYTTAPPLLKVSNNQQQVDFSALFKAAGRKFRSKGVRQPALMCAYLNVIFLEALNLRDVPDVQTTASAGVDIVHRFRLHAERYFIERLQVQDYAERLGITANHLVETVRTMTGMTPGQILKERLVLEAKRLLVHTSASAAEISYKLAFKNPSQFGRWFRNVEGVSPGLFREQFTVPNVLV